MTMKKLHYERMHKEPKAAQKGSLVEANFAMGKGLSSFAFVRKTNPSFVGKLEPIPESKERIFVQTTWFVKSIEGLEDEGFEVAMSISISTGLSLDDKFVSISLDLTTDLCPSSTDIAHSKQYQFKD